MKQYSWRDTIYACYAGYITQAVVNNLAPLLFVIFIEQYHIPLTRITLLTTFNFLTQLAVDMLAAKSADSIGYRQVAVGAHIFSTAGLLALAVLPNVIEPFTGLFIACLLYAIGGGLIEVIISPIVEACPGDQKASAMSLLHSFYCWGCAAVIIFSTLFLKLAGKSNWFYLPVIWACLPLFNAFRFRKVPISTLTSADEGMSVRSLFRSGLFWIFFLLMITSGASELSVAQWASAFAEKGLNVSKTTGDLLGPCLFALLMGTSRLYYGKYGQSIDLKKFISFSALLCVCSYLLIVFAPHPFLSLAGCGLCGLSVGIMWPGVFSLASAAIPMGGTAMFALLALAGDVGCSLGPTVVGEVSALLGGDLHTGILIAVIFPLAMVIVLRFLKTNQS